MCIRDRHNLEAKLEKVEHAIKSRTDDVVDFKQMGIDHIFIDESHHPAPRCRRLRRGR